MSKRRLSAVALFVLSTGMCGCGKPDESHKEPSFTDQSFDLNLILALRPVPESAEFQHYGNLPWPEGARPTPGLIRRSIESVIGTPGDWERPGVYLRVNGAKLEVRNTPQIQRKIYTYLETIGLFVRSGTAGEPGR
jgi:hypothetical protein